MLKRGPFSFISYKLVKESKGIIFSAKIASFFTGFEGRKRVVFTLLLRALRAVKKNLNSLLHVLCPDFTWKGFLK